MGQKAGGTKKGGRVGGNGESLVHVMQRLATKHWLSVPSYTHLANTKQYLLFGAGNASPDS